MPMNMKPPTKSPDSARGPLLLAGVFVLVLVLVAATPCVVWAETSGDVEESAEVPDALAGLADAGILLGRDASPIVPQGYVTRGQMAIFLARALGLEDSAAAGFRDMTGAEECFGAVGALYELGLVTGTDPESFSPDELIRRERAVLWMIDCLGYKVARDPGSDVPFRLSYYEEVDAWLGGFRDRTLIDRDCVRAAANASRLGIIDSEGGWFYPTLPLSWDDMAIMLARVFAEPLEPRTEHPAYLEARTGYAAQTLKSEGPMVLYLEYRLRQLQYRPGPVDGVYDSRTRDAVMAFQKVEGLRRDGVAGGAVWGHIGDAETPTPKKTGEGTRVEVDLTRQVLMMITDNEVWKIVHVSTGAHGTRTGHFQIKGKFKGWVECVTLTGRMYFPSYVVSRTAIHGYPSVPSYPASHGCIRVPVWMAEELFYEMPNGMTVDVFYSR